MATECKDCIEIKVPRHLLEKAEGMLNRLESLSMSPDDVSPDQAKIKILHALDGFKAAGTKSITIVDVYNKTKLPLEMINPLMEELENEGRILEEH